MTVTDTPWWLDAERIQQELAKHGSLAAAARAHNIKPATVTAGWRNLGLPPLPRGPQAAHTTPHDAPVSEEETLRQRNHELERALAQRRDSDVFDERIVRAIQASLQASTPKYKPPKPRAGVKDPHEFVLLWSDTHAAEIVSREETNGLNEYDWPTMLRRHQRLHEAVVAYKENRPYRVDRLHVLALGDMLSGNIHEELSETNEFPLAEATVQAGLDFSEWLEEFIPHFGEVRFAGIVGNHPRAHKKPRAKKTFDNADWTMYRIMEQRLAKTRIRFEIPKAPKWPVEVCGRRILMFHGDGIRSSMPGVPWGGVMRRVAAMQNEYAAANLPIDHFVLGHFHSANIVQGGQVVMNGSVKGIDEFSLRAFGGGQRPKQVLLTFHPKRGLVDASILDLDAA